MLIDLLDEIDEDFSPTNEVKDIDDLPQDNVDDPYGDDFEEAPESRAEESKEGIRQDFTSNPGSQSVQPASHNDDLINKNPDEIDEEEGLTIAENCFAKIAEKMIEKGTTVKEHY